jgi:hypothetical protein
MINRSRLGGWNAFPASRKNSYSCRWRCTLLFQLPGAFSNPDIAVAFGFTGPPRKSVITILRKGRCGWSHCGLEIAPGMSGEGL